MVDGHVVFVLILVWQLQKWFNNDEQLKIESDCKSVRQEMMRFVQNVRDRFNKAESTEDQQSLGVSEDFLSLFLKQAKKDRFYLGQQD